MFDDTVIASIPKNSSEELRVFLSRYQGHDLCGLRVFYEAKDGSGSMLPGKSGVNVRVAMLPAIIEALQEAKAEAERRGLLERLAA